MFFRICILVCIVYLNASVHSKVTLSTNEADRQPLSLDGNACEDQLVKYRKFMLHALINTADVCNTFDVLPSVDFNELQSTTEQHAELANYLRVSVQRLTDKQINNAIEEAVLESCSQKNAQQANMPTIQQQVKREYVVLGKKQRFHAWGGKRAENAHNEPASLYFL